MDKRQLYESIMATVAKEVKKALNEDNKNFNNAEAYRFLDLYVTKAIKMTMGDNVELPKKSTSDTKKFRPIKLILKIGKTKKDAYISMCYHDKHEVAVSQSKMMSMKYLAFICDGKIYVVNGDILRSNWGNKNVCYIETRTYRDAIGEDSMMTNFNLDFLKENAEDVISMTDDAIMMYEKAYNEMSLTRI